MVKISSSKPIAIYFGGRYVGTVSQEVYDDNILSEQAHKIIEEAMRRELDEH